MSTIKKSLTFEEKLNNRFAPSPIVAQFDTLFSAAENPNSFQSQEELQDYLAEGALLSLNTIGSQALSIPCGEYMVWTTNNGNTMLVPTEAQAPTQEVFEAQQDQYEIHTPDILAVYNCFGKAILESASTQNPNFQDNKAEVGGEEGHEGEHGGFQSKIQMKSVDRNPIARAMAAQGYTVTSLASACGVDPPAISRILRTPKDTSGDPGGRNPSMGLAAQISHALDEDPTALFPDIFGKENKKLGARKQPGNRGSGMKGSAAGSARMGAATDKWTQGAQGTAQNEALEKVAKQIAETGKRRPVKPHASHDEVQQSGRYGNYSVGPGYMGFDYSHDDFDGGPWEAGGPPMDPRSGNMPCMHSALHDIDDIESEYGYDETIGGVSPDEDGTYRNVPGSSVDFSLKKPAADDNEDWDAAREEEQEGMGPAMPGY